MIKTVNGQQIVVQHMFPIADIKVGQHWAYADGSSGEVTITAVNYDEQDVTYANSRTGSSHTKDAFSFQTRYCMIVG